MHKHLYIVLIILYTALLFPSCRLKKGAVAEKGAIVGDFGKQPLCGEIIADMESTDNSLASRETLGLWWQNDSLRITLNQGHRLRYYHSKGDTLYLHEAPRDTMDMNTRQYVIHILQQELLIIKYNDSLVYPLMPIPAKCEYPLDIKSMSAKKLDEFKKKQEESKNKPQTQPVLMPNSAIYPLEVCAGTYLWNVKQSQDSLECSCMIDSSKVLLLNLDGSWLQYSNKSLINCGIMRKTKSSVYEMFDYKKEIVYFLDTTAFNGHIIGMKEDTRRWKENIPYAPNEYLFIGRHSIISYKLFPYRQDSTMLLFFEYGEDYFMLNGTRCGWKKISNK